MTLNHYEVLGVSPEATLDEIKAAHRRLARAYHPDKAVEGAPTESLPFQRVQVAWECLRQQASKRKYDESLSRALSKQKAAIPLDLSEMEEGRDEDSASVCFIYKCRCGEDVVIWEDELVRRSNTAIVECSGCSFAYLVRNDQANYGCPEQGPRPERNEAD